MPKTAPLAKQAEIPASKPCSPVELGRGQKLHARKGFGFIQNNLKTPKLSYKGQCWERKNPWFELIKTARCNITQLLGF